MVLNKYVVWIWFYIFIFILCLSSISFKSCIRLYMCFGIFIKFISRLKSPRSLTARVKLRETSSLIYICYIAIKLINKVYVRQEFLQQKQRSIFSNRKGKTKIMTYVPISVFPQFPFCRNFRCFLLFSTMLQI